MLPAPTAHLRFREMTDADLDSMAGLLGDPEVMRFYPAPLSREEAAAWIAGNQRRYTEDGHGLWIIEARAAEVGGCSDGGRSGGGRLSGDVVHGPAVPVGDAAVHEDEWVFVGDCGLTWQQVNGERRLEVGYHVRADLQGRGYATEAAAACRDHARDALGSPELVAIIHPANTASRRVAEKIGMRHVGDDVSGARATCEALGIASRTVMGMTF